MNIIMAERGAHMTATSHAKPSIFELLAQESLASTIHPSCTQLAKFLILRNPDKFGWLSKWFEEVYFVLDLVVQYHYLRKHGASFSENFYGLMRISTSGKITSRHLVYSLFQIVVTRYLRTKFEQWVEKRKQEVGVTNEREGWRNKVDKIIIQAHGLCHAAWEGICIGQILSYMSGSSNSHNPLLSLAHLTLAESSSESERDWHWKNIWNRESLGRLRIPYFMLAVTGKMLSHSLEIGAFFLQFLHWWNQEGGKAKFVELPIPEPPKVDCKNKTFMGKCPLCLGPRRLETVLPVSGYAFCFRCIFTYIQENGKCPVTNYPASLDELIRVYADPDESA
ncbi:hypothetical protein J437_LFUL018619 [Ladona fulva]|uniref:Peroxisome assembly protein 12 n=1 Tax=Ladona fulva TaxID=123851 RepID=A0A8K0KQ25_LADFU|nr:hypothetical protein J437_LFUL018619 [Ladona fulva]